MKWKPFVSGKPYTCQDCPAYTELLAERDRYRDLAEYLCRTVPSVVVPDEIASRFPDPWVVRVCTIDEAVRGE
jgi:hypothetical protein